MILNQKVRHTQNIDFKIGLKQNKITLNFSIMYGQYTNRKQLLEKYNIFPLNNHLHFSS